MNNMPTSVFFLVIFVFAMPRSSLAQEISSIKGTILSADSALHLRGINILNLNLKNKTTSDVNGNYFMDYNNTDTIEFSHDNWETKRIVGKNLSDSIFLLKKSIQIDEVFVMGDRVSSRTAILEKLELEKNKNNAIYYKGRPPLSLLNPFGGKPITFFYELLSKSGRKARKMSAEISDELAHEKISAMFNPDLITSIVPLKGDDLNDFIQKYKPTVDQVENWTAYDAHVYIKKCFSSYTGVEKKGQK